MDPLVAYRNLQVFCQYAEPLCALPLVADGNRLRAQTWFERVISCARSFFHSQRDLRVTRLIRDSITTLRMALCSGDASPSWLVIADKVDRLLFLHAETLGLAQQAPLRGSIKNPSPKRLPTLEPGLHPFRHQGRYFNDCDETRWEHLINGLQVGCLGLLKYGIPLRHQAKEVAFPSLQNREEKLTMTWLGHASVLLQWQGLNILSDPLFSPLPGWEKRRWKPHLSLEELPLIDVVIISHNHRDHLDEPSMKALRKYQPLVLVPEGLKTWFQSRGFERVEELSWGEGIRIQERSLLEIHCASARHWSQRKLFDQNESLWSGWVLRSEDYKVYFAGDTAFDSEFFQDTLSRHGPIDVAFLPIGPCTPHSRVKHSHMSGAEVWEAGEILQARRIIPIHWGTYRMGTDDYDTPLEHLNP